MAKTKNASKRRAKDQARKAALALFHSRRKLRILRERAKLQQLNTSEKTKAERLVVEINNHKAFLEELGLDSQEGEAWAKREVHNKSRKTKKTGSSSRANGVGMYGLGQTLKFWK